MKGLNLHFYANLFCFIIFNFYFLNPKKKKKEKNPIDISKRLLENKELVYYTNFSSTC